MHPFYFPLDMTEYFTYYGCNRRIGLTQQALPAKVFPPLLDVLTTYDGISTRWVPVLAVLLEPGGAQGYRKHLGEVYDPLAHWTSMPVG